MTERQLGRLRVVLPCICILVFASRAEAVVPVLVGPFQAFLALLPSILAALGGILIATFRPSTAKHVVQFLWHQKIFTVCLIVAVGGVVYASRNNWWIQREISEAQGGSNWTAFRGGSHRRGYVPARDAEDPTAADPIWDFAREKTIYSSPTVVGNRVYTTFADYGPFSDRGGILCIDAESGAEAWRYTGEGFRATFSSPSVKDDYIVSGEGLHQTNNARVICVNRKGERLWSHRTGSHVESSPCLYRGHAYIGAGDDGYYCIALKPAEGGKPDIKWHLKGDRYRDCETSPIAYDGVVYFGLGLGGKAIVAVDADPSKKGKELWRLATPYPVFAPPTAAQGRLYIGMGNGDFVNSAEVVRSKIIAKLREAHRSAKEIEEATRGLGPAGEVWCIDLKKEAADPQDRVVWKYKVGRTVLGAVAVKGDRLYFGSRDKHVYCVSTSGKLIARWNARSEVKTSPAVAKEHVYVVSGSGFLHCLTADTLEPVWEMRLGAGELFISSPTVALGHVYVGTPLDGLRCIGRVGPPPPVVWGHGARGGRVARSPVPPRAKLAWRFPKTGRTKLQVTAPLVPFIKWIVVKPDKGGKSGRKKFDKVASLIVPCLRGGKAELIKLRVDYKLDDEQRVAWAAPFTHPITVPPVAIGNEITDDTESIPGSIYAVDGEPGDAGRTLRCIDPETGAERWRLPIAAQASGQITLDRQRLFVWTGKNTLTCYPVDPGANAPPAPLWQRTLGPGAVPPQVSEGILFVATERRLMALDSATGAPLWRTPVELPAKSNCAPVRAGRSVVVVSDVGVTAYGVVDGAWQWTAKLGPVHAPLALSAETITVISDSGNMEVLDRGALDKLLLLEDWLKPTTTAEDKKSPALAEFLAWAERGQGDIEASLAVMGLRPGEVKPAAELRSVLADRHKVFRDPAALLAVLRRIRENAPPVRRVADVAAGVPPLTASGRIIFAGKKDLRVLHSLDAERPYQWASSGWLGKILRPLLLIDSHVYFVTDKYGVICVKPSKR